MHGLISLIVIVNLLLVGAPKEAYGHNYNDEPGHPFPLESQLEREYDFMESINHDRHISTVSVNIFKKTREQEGLSFYRGVTITRPQGEIDYKGETLDSTAFGIGPVGLARYSLREFNRLSVWFDMSGALIFYSEKFPAGGRHYNFMWRIGPKFIYRISENFSVNLGYKIMHVSNGYLSGYHNPAYDSEGFSLCLLKLF